jgi:hypothetical protein
MEFPFRIRIGPRQIPAVGWLWHAAAVALALVAIYVGGIPPNSVEKVAFVVLLIFGVFELYRRGHRHFVGSAARVTAADARPPILYLRSFESEADLRDDERALAKIFRELGPFIAIGDPSDPLPPLGAWRDYLPDDGWQDVVHDRITSAQLVVLVSGSTPGLGWEIERCRNHLEPRRLVVLVRRGEAAFETFRRICTDAGLQIPPYPAEPSDQAPLVGMVTFDDAWRANAQSTSGIEVLDAFTTVSKREAIWRTRLREVFLRNDIRTSWNLRGLVVEHWRILPLAAIVGLARLTLVGG